MATRVKDKDGVAYDFFTEKEAKDCTGKKMEFKSEQEAREFLEKLMETPEGEAQLRQLFGRLNAH